MKFLYVLIFVIEVSFSFAQGGSIVLGTGQIVNTTQTAIYTLGDIIQFSNTLVKNDGSIFLTKDWENNSTTSGIDTLFGNGKVILDGEIQKVKGTNKTYFYDLNFSNTEVKSAEVDFFIRNQLDLNDATLEVNDNKVHLTNPEVTALSWEDGFISSDNISGYFLRSTNSTSEYSFPLGSSELNNNYRAIEITPTTSDSSVYGARLAAKDASLESGISAAGSVAPFDLNNTETSLTNLNENYYWAINKFYGVSEANVNFYPFQSDAENEFSSLAKWSSIEGIWKKENFNLIAPNTPKPEFNAPDLLVKSTNVLTYEDDIYTLAEVNLRFPQVITPNDDGLNETLFIENLDLYPANSIQIYNRWGEQIYSAVPYNNDWSGKNESSTSKIQGNTLQEDTYFYILDLGDGSDPIKKYVELIRN